MPSEKTEAYLQLAGEQMRSKRAQGMVVDELRAHIEDARAAYQSRGVENVEEAALRSMGDPVLVGQALDAVHRPRPAWGMLTLTAALGRRGWGSISRWAAKAMRQYLGACAAGLAALAALYFFDFSFLVKYPARCWLVLSAACLASGYAAGRCFTADMPLRELPALALLYVPLFAAFLFLQRGRGWKGVWLCGLWWLLSLAPMVSMMRVTDLMLVTLTCLLMLTAAVWRRWFGGKRMVQLLSIGIPVGLVLARLAPLMWKRLKAECHPELDGSGYVPMQLRRLLAGVQPFGQTAALTPGDRTLYSMGQYWGGSYELSYVALRFGWVAAALLVLLVSGFLLLLLLAGLRNKNRLGAMTALSVGTLFWLEWALYLPANLGGMLASGFAASLPVFSGGEAAAVQFALLGLALSSWRGQDITPQPGRKRGRWNPSLHFSGGKLVLDLDPAGLLAMHRKSAKA